MAFLKRAIWYEEARATEKIDTKELRGPIEKGWAQMRAPVDTTALRSLLAMASMAPWITDEDENAPLNSTAVLVPWETDGASIYSYKNVCGPSGGMLPLDALFIAAMRNAAPALLDELDRLRALVDSPLTDAPTSGEFDNAIKAAAEALVDPSTLTLYLAVTLPNILRCLRYLQTLLARAAAAKVASSEET